MTDENLRTESSHRSEAYALVEALSSMGGMLAGLRKHGIKIEAPAELWDAMKRSGHPDAVAVLACVDRHFGR